MSRPSVPASLPRLAALAALAATTLAAALLMRGPAQAQGAPRSIGECERLKNDLAYNQCLAMFGPEARMITGGDGAPGRGPSAPQASAAAMAAIPYAEGLPAPVEEPVLQGGASGAAPERGSRAYRRGGRQHASFEIGGAGATRRWSRWRRHR